MKRREAHSEKNDLIHTVTKNELHLYTVAESLSICIIWEIE